MKNTSPTHYILIAAIAAGVMTLTSIGAPPARDRGATNAQNAPNARDSKFPSAKGLITEAAAPLDAAIAKLIQQRAEVPAAQLSRLDLRIDVRLIARHLFSQATITADGSSTQAAIHNRALALMQLIGTVDEIAQRNDEWTRAQIDAAGAIHQSTFRLPKLGSAKQLDELLTRTGAALATIAGVKNLPTMSVAFERPRATTQAARSVENGKSLAQLASLVRQASVSAPLRRQLQNLQTLCEQSVNDTSAESPFNVLRDYLEVSLDIAVALAANTAVAADDRVALESQLTEALALFNDVRLRDAGRVKIDRLQKYRELTQRLAKLAVPDELKPTFATVYVSARGNPELAASLIGSLEKFLTATTKFDARDVDAKPAENFKRALDELAKQFQKSRADFLDAANSLGKATVVSALSKQLAAIADDLHREAETFDLIYNTPATLDTLLAYKPRPNLLLEKKVTQALAPASSANASASRDEAIAFLRDLAALAAAAQEVAAIELTGIPEPISRRYAAGIFNQFKPESAKLVFRLASAAAENQSVDPARLAKLRQFKPMIEQLRLIAQAEAAMANSDDLRKLADWTLSPEEFGAMIEPYRGVVSKAFASIPGDSTEEIAAWQKQRALYEPLLRHVAAAADLAARAKDLPGDVSGQIGRFATPTDRSPLTSFRDVGFLSSVWLYYHDTGVLQGSGRNDETTILLQEISERAKR